LVAIALTLCAVFVPSAFISGITGLFFKQFEMTIAASTVISCFVSLTLSPALCAVLLKPHVHDPNERGLLKWIHRTIFGNFNRAFEWLATTYGRITCKFVTTLAAMLIAYVAFISLTAFQMSRMSTGFIPDQDIGFRQTTDDIARMKVRNAAGEMVPIGSVTTFRDQTAPYRVPRYNLFPAAEILGAAAPGVASGTAMDRMEELGAKVLPSGIVLEWTDLSHQQKEQSTPTLLIFAASALFVFLVLAAQYESWRTPLAVVLIVPMCLLPSAFGLSLRSMPIDILAQIGFIVLVGLAAKNAILIVEFAKQRQDHDDVSAEEAATHAAEIRLRPIMMTSFAFILGVAPLAVASGAMVRVAFLEEASATRMTNRVWTVERLDLITAPETVG
jgi:multidrug efflux pump subunit AcrB